MNILFFQVSKRCSLGSSLIFLLCCLAVVSSCSKDYVKDNPMPTFNQDDIQHEENLGFYLQKVYDCEVQKVSVMESAVKINGKFSGEGVFSLVEITPYMDVLKLNSAPYEEKLKSPSFQIELPRFIERDGVLYDRLLSKWAIIKSGSDYELKSHAHHVDEIFAIQHLSPVNIRSKKGMGGIIPNQYISDLKLLNISSATINVCITQFMHLTYKTGCVEHVYGGRKYYMDEAYLRNSLDNVLLEATKNQNIVVAAIILIEPAEKSADPELGKILEHPCRDGGIYTMPNMTNLESVNCYAAALDFLAKRYCTVDNLFGRISHWIIHNEVDGGRDWANMGNKPVKVFTDTYIKSMRMCYNIVRQYDVNAEVFASFSHSWTAVSNPSWYSCKEMLDLLNTYSKVEGDFQWGLAYHSYPQDLGNPCTWDDPNATFSMDTQFVTFKNLEVLNKWALDKDNKYRGEIKRSVWLSEAGVNSRSYSDEDLIKQAAGLAFAWKKIKALEGIDGIQWHNWFDNEAEGACLGLRKYLNSSHNGEAKPVWHAYRKAGTNEEDEYFEQFLPIIGISDWDIIEKF